MVSPGGVWWRCGVGVCLSFPKIIPFQNFALFSVVSKYQSQSLISDHFHQLLVHFEIILKPILQLEHLINPCP